MTAQWGQSYEEQRTAQVRRSVLDFEAWKPVLLTPRLLKYRSRGRSWFVFGGCGLMLFLIFAWAMLIWVVALTALTWDFGVLVAYAVVLCTVGPVRRMRARRRLGA